jgi:DNA (cytosine-5)-methyltransferase 1
MPRVLSFFTGAGGLDLGMTQAGLEPDVAVELAPVFCRTLRDNLGKQVRVLEADVSALNLKDLAVGKGEVDLMIGGPPCQSFSTGGGRAGLSDPRGNLIFEYMALIGRVRPKAFVLENVANLITAAVRHRPIAERPGKRWNLSSYSTANASDPEGNFPPLASDELSGSAVRYLMDTLEETLGYTVSVGVLDAAEYGAPQHRMRFVMVGGRDGKAPTLPAPTHGPRGSRPFATVRDAIWALQEDPGPGSAYTDPVRAVFDQVPEGGNWRSLPPDVARAALGERSYAAGGGKTGFYRRLSWDRPAPTITGRPNRKGSALCHPTASRPLSVKECARIQGFPDTWRIAGSVGDQYLQIGNAVPVALGTAIGRTMTEFLNGSSAIETRDVDEMIRDATNALRATARNKRKKGDVTA